MLLEITAFWAMTPCGCVNIYQRFEIYKCCQLQGPEVQKDLDPESKHNTFQHLADMQTHSLTRHMIYTPSDRMLSGLRPCCSVP